MELLFDCKKINKINLSSLDKESLNDFSNKVVKWGETYLDDTKTLVLNESFKNLKLYPLKNISRPLRYCLNSFYLHQLEYIKGWIKFQRQ